MSDLQTEIISGVIGAVAGALSGAAAGWIIAPTQAEREERGRLRLEGRRKIADAVAKLDYQVIEARGRLLRLESIDQLLDRARFVEFAGAVRQGAAFLPRLERWRIEHSSRNLTGRLVWRLTEIMPPDRYPEIDEASLMRATADTRTSVDSPLCGPLLATKRPTDDQWDLALKAIEKIRRRYPG